MPELPKTIRVGYRDYTIGEYEPRLAEAEGNAGWHSAFLMEIRVRTDHRPAEVANTLLHETLHAAYKHGALAPGDDEEHVVTVLANQLTQVWRDNPEFVTFMSTCLWSEGEHV